jgi:hypothetical protein
VNARALRFSYHPCVQRVAVTAKLKPGSHEAAAELLRAGPQYDPGEIGLVRHGVYLGSSEVVFLFEGLDVENLLREILNDQAVSASFAVWGPLLEGPPSAAHELFYWEAAGESADKAAGATSKDP